MPEDQAVLKYEHIVDAVFHQPWAILPSVYATICELVKFRSDGHFYSQDEIQERIGAAPVRSGVARNGAVAVLTLYGVVAQRMNLMNAMSGGTSTQQFAQQFRSALNDPQVSAIVIDVDSPGGSVFGVQELASEIYQARGQKPIVAVADSLMASAAYWIGTAADELVVTPSGEVGSIGVIAQHVDVSREQEAAGITNTLITAGKYKGEGNPYQPLEDEARQYLQQRVDQYYGMFVQAVARHRGASVSDVRSGFGQGRTVGSQEAVRLGMADRIATLDQTIARLLGSGGGRNGSKALEIGPLVHGTTSTDSNATGDADSDLNLSDQALDETPEEADAEPDCLTKPRMDYRRRLLLR